MEPNFRYPAPEYYPIRHFNQYPVEESPFSQTPFAVNSDYYVNNRTLDLESDLSRLNISSPTPAYHLYTGFNGGRTASGGNGGGFVAGRQENGVLEGRFGSSSSCNVTRVFLQGLQNNLDEICLKDLRGQIVSLAMDQHGSRLLQTKFDSFNGDEIDMIFGEVIDHVPELMMDQFGNYLIQKLVEACSEEQTTEILLAITNTEYTLVSVCLNIHGTRAVQKLLQFLTTPQQISLLMLAMTHSAVRLTKDINGHHVIKHCLKHFPYEDTKHLLKEMADHCLKIATDKIGCCVLPACVEASRGEQRERLLTAIIGNALILAEDRYGNYLIQYLLGLKNAQVTSNLIRHLEGNFVTLSCNKYGSNVVEKCLTDSAEEQSRVIVMELLRDPDIYILLNDPFGNYVFQSALAISQGAVLNALVKLVELHSMSMRNNLYGKKILAWLDKKKNGNAYIRTIINRR